MAFIIFLGGGFLGLLTAVLSMLTLGFSVGMAFALYLTMGVVLPFIALVQMQYERRRKIILGRFEI